MKRTLALIFVSFTVAMLVGYIIIMGILLFIASPTIFCIVMLFLTTMVYIVYECTKQ